MSSRATTGYCDSTLGASRNPQNRCRKLLHYRLDQDGLRRLNLGSPPGLVEIDQSFSKPSRHVDRHRPFVALPSRTLPHSGHPTVELVHWHMLKIYVGAANLQLLRRKFTLLGDLPIDG